MKKLILIFLLLASIVNAQGVSVVKNVQDEIRLGEILNVNININNPENISKSYELIETIPQGFTLINPSEPDEIEQRNAISIKLYKWRIEIEPNKVFSLNYQIKPDKPGEYVIPPTKLRDLSNNNIFLSDSRQILVLCTADNQCSEGENSINCPEDCGESLSDGICDYKADGICDLDCSEEPDCKNTKQINSYTYFIITAFLIIIILFLLWFFKKGRNT